MTEKNKLWIERISISCGFLSALLLIGDIIFPSWHLSSGIILLPVLLTSGAGIAYVLLKGITIGVRLLLRKHRGLRNDQDCSR